VRQDWSPAQVAGWLSREKRSRVSHERIHQHIYADKARGGDLHEPLRCRKRRRKRYGTYDRRSTLPNRRSIEERPLIIEQRRRIGGWEADTIMPRLNDSATQCCASFKPSATSQISRSSQVAASLSGRLRCGESQPGSCVVEHSTKMRGSARRKRLAWARPNNGMHPTGKSVDVRREARMPLSILSGG